jgi:plasmid stability protein
MQKGLKKGVHLYLRTHSMQLLREAAENHQRSLATEASRILKKTLRLGQNSGKGSEDATETDKYNANGLYVNLSEELLVRLRLLAERNYRSLAGEVAYILESVLDLTKNQAEVMAAKSKQILKFKQKLRPSKSAR